MPLATPTSSCGVALSHAHRQQQLVLVERSRNAHHVDVAIVIAIHTFGRNST